MRVCSGQSPPNDGRNSLYGSKLSRLSLTRLADGLPVQKKKQHYLLHTYCADHP
jgi:hypothetical protein